MDVKCNCYRCAMQLSHWVGGFGVHLSLYHYPYCKWKRHSYSCCKVQKKFLPWVTQHSVRLMNLTRRKEKWKISSSQITKGNITGLTIDDKMVYLNLPYSKIEVFFMAFFYKNHKSAFHQIFIIKSLSLWDTQSYIRSSFCNVKKIILQALWVESFQSQRERKWYALIIKKPRLRLLISLL